MKTRYRRAGANDPLGTFGLLLLGLVGRLVELASPSDHSGHGRLRAWLARGALDGIAVIGWTVDRLGARTPAGQTDQHAQPATVPLAPRQRRDAA